VALQPLVGPWRPFQFPTAINSRTSLLQDHYLHTGQHKHNKHNASIGIPTHNSIINYQISKTVVLWDAFTAVAIMSSRVLYRVALFRTDVSENALSPSEGVLMLTGYHSCVTVGTLLLSPYIEGHCHCTKNSFLGWFYWGVNYRCLLGLRTVYHYFEPTFRRTYLLHLGGPYVDRSPPLCAQAETVVRRL
jgi:hypothetical protein